jgi:histidyl-tRNA synthetase
VTLRLRSGQASGEHCVIRDWGRGAVWRPGIGSSMTENKQFRAIKGTRDILPPDSAIWNRFERTAREVFETYGFGEIRTPILEETALFSRSIGGDTDVVLKEMFTFEDKPTTLPRPNSTTVPEDFTGVIEQALKSGQIPRSAENQGVLERLKDHLANMRNAEGASDYGRLASERDLWISETTNLRYGDSVTLRPEATAGICRAYIEHRMDLLPGNVKLYCMGPMFRRERPQKGRYRQFYQMDAEVLGQSDAPGIDAELIEMLLVLLGRAGLNKTKLYVNSIGDKNCRPAYVEALRKALREEAAKTDSPLGPDSRRRIETNPVRVLDSKLPEEQALIERLPKITNYLCAGCQEHYRQLKQELDLRDIKYKENWRLVRGLDYYTRTTFEVTAEGLGSQNAVSGGGRYDGLVELLGGSPTKGIGFAIGTDRAILSIEETGRAPILPGLSVYVAWMGQVANPVAVAIARKLREAGVTVELPAEEMKLKKALGLADKLGARYALILGEEEVASKTYTLKRLADSEQMSSGEAELLQYLESEKRRA